MAALHHLLAVPDSWCTRSARCLFAGGACSGLFIGTVCGWSAISGVLLPDGVFSDSQAPAEKLLAIYTAAVCAMSLSGTPAGLLCDRAPLAWGVAAAGSCVVLGSLAIGLLPSSSGFGFLGPFVLLAIGGNTTFFAATKLGFYFPSEQRPAILATICALYDASSAVSLLFFLAYKAGFSRRAIFVGYALLGAILFGGWGSSAAGIHVEVAGGVAEQHKLGGSSSGSSSGSIGKETGREGCRETGEAGVGDGDQTPTAHTAMHRSPSFTSQALTVAAVVSPSKRSQSPAAFRARSAQGSESANTEPLLGGDGQHAMRSQTARGPDVVAASVVAAAEAAATAEEAEVPRALEGLGGVKARIDHVDEEEDGESLAYGAVPELHDASLLRQLGSSQLVVGLGWYLLSQQRVNLYLGTARTLLLAQGDVTGFYAALHTALLPAGLAFVPLIARSHASHGVLGTMQLTTLTGLVHGLCAVWLPLQWQWVTFAIFAFLRMATFATFSIYTASAFGEAASATLTGFIFLVGGLASLTLVPIGSYVAEALEGDWAWVYHAYTLLCLPQLALLSIASCRWERQRRCQSPRSDWDSSSAAAATASSADYVPPPVPPIGCP